MQTIYIYIKELSVFENIKQIPANIILVLFVYLFSIDPNSSLSLPLSDCLRNIPGLSDNLAEKIKGLCNANSILSACE